MTRAVKPGGGGESARSNRGGADRGAAAAAPGKTLGIKTFAFDM